MTEEKPVNGAEAAAGPDDDKDSQKPVIQREEEKSLQRRSRMNSEKAQAIARLRSSEVPEGCGIQYDTTPSAGNQDVEVVFKERTAL